MKTIKQIAVTAAFLLASFSLVAQSTEVKDTVFFFNQKKVALSDSLDQVKVKVYRMDSTEYKQVYEGIYTDDRTFESYSVSHVSPFSFDFPFKKKREKLSGHFTGFSLGALYTHQNFKEFNDAGGMKLSFSNEFSFNPIGYTLPLVHSYFGITTGIGMT